MPGRPVGLPKTGGRKKGSPNKKNKEFLALLEELKFSPARKIIELLESGERECVCQTAKRKSEDDCPRCFGYGVIPISDSAYSQLLTRLMDSEFPKLTAKTIDKTVRRVTLARMNSLTVKEQEQVTNVIEGEVINE